MTQDERLHYCVNCKNKRVDFKQGLVCDITGFPPAFEDQCPSYLPIKSDEDRPMFRSQRSALDNYRPNKDRANYAIAMLIISIVYTLIQMILSWGKVSEFQSVSGDQLLTQELLESLVGSVVLTTFISVAIYITTAIVFLNWFRRAYFNLQSRVPDLKSTDSYAVWSWFIPIVNFYQPYQIAKELWIETKSFLNRKNAKIYENSEDVIINIWWFFWIFHGLISRFVFFKFREVGSIDELITSYKFDVYIMPLEIIGAICAIEVIRKFSKMEEAVAQQIKSNDMPNNLDEIKGA